MRMDVPSKDVRLKSVELPATATALVDCQPSGGRHVAERTAPVAGDAPDADDERTETHAVKMSALVTTRNTPSRPRLDVDRRVKALPRSVPLDHVKRRNRPIPTWCYRFQMRAALCSTIRSRSLSGMPAKRSSITDSDFGQVETGCG